jgi:hypothetical protein
MIKFSLKEKNISYIYFFVVFWAAIFIVNYYFFNGIPSFICNDSFQYLSIAHDIYNDKKSTGLINYALDIYYDELALFKYDFNKLKPYHFPSYSAFLSIFYYIYDNHNFVIYFSQYLSFLIFSISTFLVLSHYHKKQTALLITLICFFCTAIIHYISDSGKEILCAGLAMLGIYLGLYYKNRNNLKIILILSIIFTFLSITRNFYLVLSFLIFAFRALPSKYKEKDLEETLKTKSTFFFLVFLIPLLAYIYCYYFIEIHLFIFDNRTDFYGGKNLKDLLLRIFSNLFLGIFIFFSQYFQYIIDSFKIFGLTGLFGLYQTFGFSLIAIFFYFKGEIKNFFIKKSIKISKLFIINLFFGLLLLAIIARFSILGYRLTMGYLPIVFMLIYQTFFFQKNFKKIDFLKNYGTIFFIVFIITNFIYNILFVVHNKNSVIESKKLNDYVKSIIAETNSKKIVASSSYFNNSHLMPLMHQYPSDIYFFSTWRFNNLCEDLMNYHEHKIDFDIIFSSGKFDKDKCGFVEKNFYLKSVDSYGAIYIKNPN